MRIQVKSNWKQVISPGYFMEIFNEILSKEDDLDQNKEHIWVAGLSSSQRIQYIDLIHLGTTSSCTAAPKDIFRRAVIKGTSGIIMVHNHPGGDPAPSSYDFDLTKRMIMSGDVLGIKLLDHIIVAEDCFYSFSEKGNM